MEKVNEDIIEEWFLRRNISAGTQIYYRRALSIFQIY